MLVVQSVSEHYVPWAFATSEHSEVAFALNELLALVACALIELEARVAFAGIGVSVMRGLETRREA